MTLADSESGLTASSAIPADTVVRKTDRRARSRGGGIFALRRPVPHWAGCVARACCALPSCSASGGFSLAARTRSGFISLYDRCPARRKHSIAEQLRRLVVRQCADAQPVRQLAARRARVLRWPPRSAIPLGVLCGCFPWVNAFFAPLNVFGRNIPIAALIPLTFALVRHRRAAKGDVHLHRRRGVRHDGHRHGDRRRQQPLHRHGVHARRIALADHSEGARAAGDAAVFNSLRLLFGLAFGYIMLAELVTEGGGAGGLGQHHQHGAATRTSRDDLARADGHSRGRTGDRPLLYMIQKSLFPHQYGGHGLLHNAWRGLMHVLRRCEAPDYFADSRLMPAQQAALADRAERIDGTVQVVVASHAGSFVDCS